MHCRTCALVTSSGQLTASKRGEEIDRSECVIRMNDAPSLGYQQDVGRRASLRVIAHSSLQRVLQSRQELLNMSQDTVFIFWGPSSCMRRDGKGHVYNNLKLLNQLLPKLKIMVTFLLRTLDFSSCLTPNPPLTQFVFDIIKMVFVKIFKGSKHDFTINWQHHSWLHPVLLTRSVKANVCFQ